MKRKILLSCLFIITLAIKTTVFAQNDEYYRPDTVKKERPVRKEMPSVEEKSEKKEFIEKKEKTDLSLLTFKERLRLGGSFGLSFGTYTNINISPMAGYQLTDKLVGGIGATYMFIKQKYYSADSYYGGRTFLMYSILPVVNLQVEYEALNVRGNVERQWLSSPMIGASYSQPIGGRFTKAVHFTVLYNLNYNNQVDAYSSPAARFNNLSPYGSPFVLRVTFL